MNVDRLAFDRPLVGEDLHAVDQLHDAVGFIADELASASGRRRRPTARATEPRREYPTANY